MHTFVVLAYKESEYLEECIKSVLNQKYSSHVVIATSTPNRFISDMAKKYDLDVFINPNSGQGIGYDFDFALSCGNTELVTIAHQDDIYDYNYSYEIIKKFNTRRDASIIFSDYYEIRKEGKIYKNINLIIKRILLLPIKINIFSKLTFGKRLILRFGNAICCPAVTFVKKNIDIEDIFKCEFVCDVDWYAWEKLSIRKGSFVFVDQCLMGHRVHTNSTTTDIISKHIRTKEDLEMFQKFWPNWISKIINRLYVKAEKSNIN